MTALEPTQLRDLIPALPSPQRAIPASRLLGSDRPTVWSEFQGLGVETGAVNLGQGFPDWQPPRFVVEQAHAALTDGFHQYTRPAGHPNLVEVLAARYSRHLGREVEPMSEVTVTVGASQALFLTLQALLNPGDEVILLEPAFDLYYGQIRLAGGTAVPVALTHDVEAGEWKLDAEALRAAVTPRTKFIVLNSPHNPTGKAFTKPDMEAIAEVVREHDDLLVISDEVYKYIIHAEGVSHHHFAALPGMFDRTVTISSAGKTFSITGWQAGWCIGPARLIKPIQLLLPYVQFCVSTPMQQALSRVLSLADEPFEGHDSYYKWLSEMYRKKRKLLADGLESAGMKPLRGDGGFFIFADTSDIEVPEAYLRQSTPAAPKMTRDWALCRYLAMEAGVLAIPSSPFFSPQNRDLGGNFVRFAFCKSDETLSLASEKLKEHFG